MPLRVMMTCSACPEQYDVLDGDKTVGYLRLRHGRFYAAYPDVGGKVVYEHHFPDKRGCFDNKGERDYHLRFAVDAITKTIASEPPKAPDVDFILDLNGHEDFAG
jgi:hypothetical protein